MEKQSPQSLSTEDVLQRLRFLGLPATTAWEWVPAGTGPLHRMLIHPLDVHGDRAPLLLRGSKFLRESPPSPAIQAERFCMRAARRIRLTTSYRWQFQQTEAEQELVNKISRSANNRFPRQRSGTEVMNPNDFYRFRDGKRVSLFNEPELKAEFDAREATIRSDDFWIRHQAARELLAQAERITKRPQRERNR